MNHRSSPPSFNFTLDFLPLDQPSGTEGHIPAYIMESGVSERWLSASGGSADVKGAGTTVMDSRIVVGTNMVAGNGVSPLENVNPPPYGPIKTGNGSGNPSKVIMRQLVDMSSANVTMVDTPAFTATGPENQQPAFWTMANPAGDMPSEKALLYVTAGQYSYTGGDPAIGYANGQYKYAGDLGGFKLEGTDWTAYMELCDSKNIWSYDNYHPASPTCF